MNFNWKFNRKLSIHTECMPLLQFHWFSINFSTKAENCHAKCTYIWVINVYQNWKYLENNLWMYQRRMLNITQFLKAMLSPNRLEIWLTSPVVFYGSFDKTMRFGYEMAFRKTVLLHAWCGHLFAIVINRWSLILDIWFRIRNRFETLFPKIKRAFQSHQKSYVLKSVELIELFDSYAVIFFSLQFYKSKS